MAEIMRIAGAPDPFCLGVIAIHRRLLAPSYVVAHAALRRPGPDWVTPTTRQYELLRLRAAGVEVNDVATKFGMSTITVRRYLHRLGTDNGARTSTNSGALFEALQWV